MMSLEEGRAGARDELDIERSPVFLIKPGGKKPGRQRLRCGISHKKGRYFEFVAGGLPLDLLHGAAG